MSSAAGGIGSAALYAVASITASPTNVLTKPEEADDKKHHLKGGRGFTNPWESFVDMQPAKLFAAMAWRKIRGEIHMPDTTPPTVPIRTPTFHQTRSQPPNTLRATWLGHACYYVEFPSGLRVLFDPVFEDCCSPFEIKSLKRYTPPPCEIEDLPFVDAVLISHNHYDHLSYPTTLRLKKKFPNAHWWVPLGVKKWFIDSGVSEGNVTELDWWEGRDVVLEVVKGGGAVVDVKKEGEVASQAESGNESEGKTITATIAALPCQHLSARGPFDRCKTLWASWSVDSGGAKVYFAGDTGYRTVPRLPKGTDDYSAEYSHLPVCPAFAEIGKHRGPFDLGLIPIGAYEPRFIMSCMHANPKDSVNIFADTKCKKALGMHWGTWVLTEEDVMEPPRKLREAGGETQGEVEGEGVEGKKEEEEGVFDITDIGESRVVQVGGKE
ncbi:N-acyl-phosphatidylethanolamine-hydrolyzing phospholipase D [Dendryphion nanum]|uniref:N-acyl-phosphatidylethanolamine-hydrolyzing phospholipase D n=1 Tax=Dendryphion nanum TaxID=256645 RepID=A0A9P9EIP2_9PLEO|nr:N-acyl-phosphatidylethanolamine-hydrolyzing phospholipase D [Dendryphion nanum]